MKNLSESEIRAAFRGCTQGERKRLRIPDLSEVAWGDIDFLGWMDRSDSLTGYLVVAEEGGETSGLVLHGTKTTSSAIKQGMCSLCRTVHSLGGVSLFTTVKWGEPGKRGDSVGDYMCADLGCSAYLRGLKKSGRVQMPTTLTPAERIDELRLNLAVFVERVSAGTAGG